METRTSSSRQVHVSHDSGAVKVGGETVRYEILIVDARSAEDRAQAEAPGGNVIVVVPGHGQTVTGPRHLVTRFALLSRSKVAWCIDPTPTAGGDWTEAQAIVEIVHDRLSGLVPGAARAAHQATIAGWSHGGGEALRAAREAPDLFPHYIGLCPVGLVERKPPEMLVSFLLEAARILFGDLLHARWANAGQALRVGANFARGLVTDLARTRSIRCLVNDVFWACHKVPAPDFDYPGEVVLLLGTKDSVIRWKDPFPGCETPDQLAAFVPAFRQECFPQSRRLEVRLVDGNHLTPEIEPDRFVRPGLKLLDQLA